MSLDRLVSFLTGAKKSFLDKIKSTDEFGKRIAGKDRAGNAVAVHSMTDRQNNEYWATLELKYTGLDTRLLEESAKSSPEWATAGNMYQSENIRMMLGADGAVRLSYCQNEQFTNETYQTNIALMFDKLIGLVKPVPQDEIVSEVPPTDGYDVKSLVSALASKQATIYKNSTTFSLNGCRATVSITDFGKKQIRLNITTTKEPRLLNIPEGINVSYSGNKLKIRAPFSVEVTPQSMAKAVQEAAALALKYL